MRNLLTKQEGFTLLELLVVIVIIGILAVLLVPNLASGPQRARDSQRKSDLRNVQTALESYHSDKDSYPSGDYAGLTALLAPDYVKSLPTDPKTKGDYTYTPAGCTGAACTSYTLSATLENTKDSAINNPPAGYNVTSQSQ